jgi:hypothetical protein
MTIHLREEDEEEEEDVGLIYFVKLNRKENFKIVRFVK